MKNIWAKLSYWWFVGLLILVGFFTGDIKVNASVTEQWATKQVKIQTCNGNGDCSWSSNYDANHNFTGSDLSYPVTALEWRLKATNGLSVENTYTFSFGYKPTPDAIMYQRVFMRRGASYDDEEITCTNSLDSNNYYMWTCTFSPSSDYSSSQWLYVQVKFYQGYLTGLNTKISAFEERLGVSSVITQQTTIINNSINTLNNTMEDDDVDNPSSMIDDFEDLLPTNGVITNLLALPINLFTKIIGSINGTCATQRLPILSLQVNGSTHWYYVDFECITLSGIVGSTISGMIDTILTGMAIYFIAKKMIKAFENFTSMKEGDVIND